MADQSTRKKTSAASKGRKNRTKKTAQARNGQKEAIRGEILLLSVLAVCILLLLSNFGIGGTVGKVVSSVLFGLFGLPAYLFPFLFFGVFAFVISNKGNPHAYIKAGALAGLFVLVSTLVELIVNQYDPAQKLIAYYTASSKLKNGGGWIAGCVLKLLCPLVGQIGACVLVLFLSAICIVLVTERSLLAPLGRSGKRAYEDARRKQQVRTKRREARRELRRQERFEEWERKTSEDGAQTKRKLSGVSFDTKLRKEDLPQEEEHPARTQRKRSRRSDLKELTPVLDEESSSEQQLSEPELVISREQNLEDRPISADPETVSEKKPTRRSKRESAEQTAKSTLDVEQTIREQESLPKKQYKVPPLSLLTCGSKKSGDSDAHLRRTAQKLEQTLQNFGVGVHVTNASCGPSVTRYELQPEQGVKVSRIVGLADDIKLNLAVADLRIEAPIPGKAAVGIEVPNSENTAVMLRDLLESAEFKGSKSPITFAVGKDISGKVVVADIAKMPHLLVAGATGSGKSVCINTLIMSILYKSDPEQVKLILIDPKVVELSVYNGIPHLMIPVVTDPRKAAGALNWAVAEMERRYKLFADNNVRDLAGYNRKAERGETSDETDGKLPQIVIIIDELADLMMVAPGEVEGAICRLAQLARAAGLHLVLATQRPSVNVITGLIKANMPSRIAFSVSSGVDSRTIIDMNGAEKLLGKGDMLFYPAGYVKPVRVQGSFVSDGEVQSVVDYLISNNKDISSNEKVQEQIHANVLSSEISSADGGGMERDSYFQEAGALIIEKEKASIGMLQRMFKIGFNRAARIMDQLAEAGVVGPEEGTKPRKVLMTKEEFENYIKEQEE